MMNTHSDQIEQSFLLDQILSSLQARDFNKSLFYCQKSSQFSNVSPIFSALIKSIIGVIHIHTNNYVEAIQHFTSGIQIIESVPEQEKQKNYLIISSVTIKLYSNLLITYILTNRSNQSLQLLHQTLNWIMTLKNRKQTFEQLLFIMFRVTKLESVGNSPVDNSLYDEPTKACVLSAASFNCQIMNNAEEAFRLEESALGIWRAMNESQHIVLSLRRLICLATELRREEELEGYENQLSNILEENSDQFGIERSTLFKGYRQKIKIIKQIIRVLHKFSSEVLEESRGGSSSDEVPNCWKLAAKLKLYKTLKQLKSSSTPKGKQNINQIKYIRDCANNIENQSNKLVEKEIKKSNFVKTSINLLNNHLTNLTIHCERMRVSVLKEGFGELVECRPKQRQPLQRISIDNVSRYSSSKDFNTSLRTKTPMASRQLSRKQSISSRSPFRSTSISLISKGDDQKLTKKVSKYLRMCEVGQYLQKKNFSNDSGEMKFVKVTKNEIRWAGDDQKIDKENKYHFYNLKQVRGIIYGKFSQTFKKSSSKKLDSWKCFSLVLQKRTLDFYCQNESHIQFWITGISAALRRVSPTRDLILYSPGRQRWRKMFLKLTQAFIEPMKKQERLHHHDVAMAVILFGRHNYKLPKP